MLLITWDDIKNKIVHLRKLMQVYNWDADGWYDWVNTEVLDEMLIEGYVNRTVFNGASYYQITEAGIEIYWQWVELATAQGWIYDTKKARGE